MVMQIDILIYKTLLEVINSWLISVVKLIIKCTEVFLELFQHCKRQ